MTSGDRVNLAALSVLLVALVFWLSCASALPLPTVTPPDDEAIWIDFSEPSGRLVCVALFSTADPLTRFRCLTVRQLRELVAWSAAN